LGRRIPTPKRTTAERTSIFAAKINVRSGVGIRRPKTISNLAKFKENLSNKAVENRNSQRTYEMGR